MESEGHEVIQKGKKYIVNAHAGRAGTTKDEKTQFLLKGPSPGRLGPPEDGWVSIYCCYFRSKDYEKSLIEY